MNGLGDPIPLGDEVSEGRCSETRGLPNFDDDDFQCNTLHGIHGSANLPCPSPTLNPYPSVVMPANPNRVTGRNIYFALKLYQNITSIRVIKLYIFM